MPILTVQHGYGGSNIDLCEKNLSAIIGEWNRYTLNIPSVMSILTISTAVGAGTRITMSVLASWKLSALKRYQTAYLSGFKSEMYQEAGHEDGFAEAQQMMEVTLRNDIVHDIGGDLQRITHMRSWHDKIRFKHILLPIWAAAYKFRSKSYRFIVNGQTGEVQGERPYSIWKIVLAVMSVMVLILLFFAVAEKYTV